MRERSKTLPWDDAAWVEDDKPHAGHLRQRQGRYRAEVLKLGAGPHLGWKKTGELPTSKLVVSMLPLKVLLPWNYDRGNFLNAAVEATVHERLQMSRTPDEYWPTSIEQDRLFRNMLSSQPVAFNLFGNLVENPQPLLPWVEQLDPEATSVDEIRIEWAPPPKEHLDNGSAFDVCVFYRTESERGFIAVECKYAENLAIKARDHQKRVEKFREPVDALSCWRPGTYGYLNEHGRQQFMLNVSLAQSLLNGSGFTRGHSVVMACDDDTEAMTVTNDVSKCLEKGSGIVDLIWTPFDKTLQAIAGQPAWIGDFRSRYLEDPQ